MYYNVKKIIFKISSKMSTYTLKIILNNVAHNILWCFKRYKKDKHILIHFSYLYTYIVVT